MCLLFVWNVLDGSRHVAPWRRATRAFSKTQWGSRRLKVGSVSFMSRFQGVSKIAGVKKRWCFLLYIYIHILQYWSILHKRGLAVLYHLMMWDLLHRPKAPSFTQPGLWRKQCLPEDQAVRAHDHDHYSPIDKAQYTYVYLLSRWSH